MFGYLARMWLVRRLFQGSGRQRGGYGSPYGYRTPYGYGRRRSRSRGGFGFFGPFPTYSRRTRGGSSVSVTGCCLPLALSLGLAVLQALRLLLRR